MGRPLLSISVLLYLALSAAPLSAETVDGILAKAGGKPITVSDVVTEIKIRNILRERPGSVLLPIESEFSKEVLDQLINREVLFQEAKRLRAFGDDVGILDEMLAFQERFKKVEGFEQFLYLEGTSVEELAERFLQEKASRLFMEKRLSIASTVSYKEIDSYYNDNLDSYGGLELKKVEDEIRARLIEIKAEEALGEWLLGLRERGNVRYFGIPGFQRLP